jgi:hypothetical protein
MVKRASRRRTSTAESDQCQTGREAIGFVERFLRIPDGQNAGQPLVLARARSGRSTTFTTAAFAAPA